MESVVEEDRESKHKYDSDANSPVTLGESDAYQSFVKEMVRRVADGWHRHRFRRMVSGAASALHKRSRLYRRVLVRLESDSGLRERLNSRATGMVDLEGLSIGTLGPSVQVLASLVEGALLTPSADRTDSQVLLLYTVVEQTPIFERVCQGWPLLHRLELCRHLRLATASPGCRVYEQAAVGTQAFIIISGSVNITRDGGEAGVPPANTINLGPGQSFGEQALWCGVHSREETVYAMEDTTCSLAALPSRSFAAVYRLVVPAVVESQCSNSRTTFPSCGAALHYWDRARAELAAAVGASLVAPGDGLRECKQGCGEATAETKSMGKCGKQGGGGSGVVRPEEQGATFLSLQRFPLFSGLPPAKLLRVSSLFRKAVVPAGTILSQEGQVGPQFLIVESGQVRLSVRRSVGPHSGVEVEQAATTGLRGDATGSSAALGPFRHETERQEEPRVRLTAKYGNAQFHGKGEVRRRTKERNRGLYFGRYDTSFEDAKVYQIMLSELREEREGRATAATRKEDERTFSAGSYSSLAAKGKYSAHASAVRPSDKGAVRGRALGGKGVEGMSMLEAMNSEFASTLLANAEGRRGTVVAQVKSTPVTGQATRVESLHPTISELGNSTRQTGSIVQCDVQGEADIAQARRKTVPDSEDKITSPSMTAVPSSRPHQESVAFDCAAGAEGRKSGGMHTGGERSRSHSREGDNRREVGAATSADSIRRKLRVERAVAVEEEAAAQADIILRLGRGARERTSTRALTGKAVAAGDAKAQRLDASATAQRGWRFFRQHRLLAELHDRRQQARSTLRLRSGYHVGLGSEPETGSGGSWKQKTTAGQWNVATGSAMAGSTGVQPSAGTDGAYSNAAASSSPHAAVLSGGNGLGTGPMVELGRGGKTVTTVADEQVEAVVERVEVSEAGAGQCLAAAGLLRTFFPHIRGEPGNEWGEAVTAVTVTEVGVLCLEERDYGGLELQLAWRIRQAVAEQERWRSDHIVGQMAAHQAVHLPQSPPTKVCGDRGGHMQAAGKREGCDYGWRGGSQDLLSSSCRSEKQCDSGASALDAGQAISGVRTGNCVKEEKISRSETETSTCNRKSRSSSGSRGNGEGSSRSRSRSRGSGRKDRGRSSSSSSRGRRRSPDRTSREVYMRTDEDTPSDVTDMKQLLKQGLENLHRLQQSNKWGVLPREGAVEAAAVSSELVKWAVAGARASSAAVEVVLRPPATLSGVAQSSQVQLNGALPPRLRSTAPSIAANRAAVPSATAAIIEEVLDGCAKLPEDTKGRGSHTTAAPVLKPHVPAVEPSRPLLVEPLSASHFVRSQYAHHGGTATVAAVGLGSFHLTRADQPASPSSFPADIDVESPSELGRGESKDQQENQVQRTGGPTMSTSLQRGSINDERRCTSTPPDVATRTPPVCDVPFVWFDELSWRASASPSPAVPVSPFVGSPSAHPATHLPCASPVSGAPMDGVDSKKTGERTFGSGSSSLPRILPSNPTPSSGDTFMRGTTGVRSSGSWEPDITMCRRTLESPQHHPQRRPETTKCIRTNMWGKPLGAELTDEEYAKLFGRSNIEVTEPNGSQGQGGGKPPLGRRPRSAFESSRPTADQASRQHGGRGGSNQLTGFLDIRVGSIMVDSGRYEPSSRLGVSEFSEGTSAQSPPSSSTQQSNRHSPRPPSGHAGGRRGGKSRSRTVSRSNKPLVLRRAVPSHDLQPKLILGGGRRRGDHRGKGDGKERKALRGGFANWL